MVTDVIRPDAAGIQLAAECLRRGGLVAFPTETVYGLGVNALDAAAVRRLFAAKGRPPTDPLIVHVTGLSALEALANEIPVAAQALMERFWPGPLTLVLRRTDAVPLEVTAGLGTVAVRQPAHPVARALIEAAGVPVAAPSANLFSRPSPTTAAHVMEDLDGRIDLVIDGGPAAVGVESTVIDLSSALPRLLRPGGISFEQLREALPSIVIATATIPQGAVASSPGLLAKHYSPRTPTTLLSGTPDAIRKMVDAITRETSAGEGRIGLLATDEQRRSLGSGLSGLVAVDLGSEHDVDAVARRLFSGLRELDAMQLDLILAIEPAQEGGLWRAVRDRLGRAATKRMTTG